MKKLTLKNYFLVRMSLQDISIQSYLSDLMLHGQLSRSRTRFLRALAPRIEEIDKTRMEIMKRYHVLDDATQLPILFDRDGKETTDLDVGVRYKLTDKDKYDEELDVYMREDYIIDVTPANREDVYNVRKLLLESKDLFGGRNAVMFDEWCVAFENITDDVEETEKEIINKPKHDEANTEK